MNQKLEIIKELIEELNDESSTVTKDVLKILLEYNVVEVILTELDNFTEDIELDYLIQEDIIKKDDIVYYVDMNLSKDEDIIRALDGDAYIQEIVMRDPDSATKLLEELEYWRKQGRI